MARVRKDLGFGTDTAYKTKRVINPDGSFNVIKDGNRFSVRDTYQALIKMSWSKFLFIIFTSLILINMLFAMVYVAIGVKNIAGITNDGLLSNFLNAFFFSFQTYSTVGYGVMAPISPLTNFIAAIESVVGLASFSLVTGIIYGRFSKPSARLLYSENAIIAPYQKITSLQFRIANQRMSMLLELEATVTVQFTTFKNGKYHRAYHRLPLERDSILFFPLNWTLVHPINESSPLYGLTSKDFKEKNLEILVLIKGFDDTFGQTVHSRYSYLFSDIVWDAKYKLPYETIETGDVLFHMDRINDHTLLK